MRAAVVLVLALLFWSRAAPATTYIERSTIGTCGAGQDGSLQATTAGSVSKTITVTGSGASVFVRLYTLAGDPNSNAWENGSWTVQIGVNLGGNPQIFGDVFIERYNSACVLQEASAATATQNLNSTAIFTFTLTPNLVGPFACGDLIATVMEFTNIDVINQSVNVQFNLAGDTVVSPVTQNNCAAAPVVPIPSIVPIFDQPRRTYVIPKAPLAVFEPDSSPDAVQVCQQPTRCIGGAP